MGNPLLGLGISMLHHSDVSRGVSTHGTRAEMDSQGQEDEPRYVLPAWVHCAPLCSVLYGMT